MIKNNLIQNGIRKSFETGTSKIADKVCYGCSKTPDGSLAINDNEAQIVRFIFNRYLSGDSLGKIVDALEEKKVSSPSGKDKWGRKVVQKQKRQIELKCRLLEKGDIVSLLIVY